MGWTAVSALQRPAVYWHMLPEYAQARKAIWTAVNPHTGMRRIDEHFPLELRKTTREQTMEIEFKNGSLWQVVGSDSFDSLVGAGPAGVVFSEWSLANPRAWAMLRPMLAENGGWAIFPYTPRGKNHGWTLFESAKEDPDWFAQKLTVNDTGVFTQATLDAEKRELIRENGEDDGQALYEQEYLCSFNAANVGAYYARDIQRAEDDGRIRSLPYDPALRVWTAWDLGYGDATAIWFAQLDGPNVRIIDYYEASGVGLEHYARALQEKRYVYEAHIFPHDAEGGDVATGKKRIDVLRGLGVNGRVLPRDAVDDGIQAVRRMLPKCWFDKDKCKQGLNALTSYTKEWDDDRKMFKPKPRHDWASHGADAFRYLAMGLPSRMNLQVPARERDRWQRSRSDDESWRTV